MTNSIVSSSVSRPISAPAATPAANSAATSPATRAHCPPTPGFPIRLRTSHRKVLRLRSSSGKFTSASREGIRPANQPRPGNGGQGMRLREGPEAKHTVFPIGCAAVCDSLVHVCSHAGRARERTVAFGSAPFEPRRPRRGRDKLARSLAGRTDAIRAPARLEDGQDRSLQEMK